MSKKPTKVLTKAQERKQLAARVREKYGVAVPVWRNSSKHNTPIRVFSAQEKEEILSLVEFLRYDYECVRDSNIYLAYCEIMRLRNFGSLGRNGTYIYNHHHDWRRRFAARIVDSIYYDMCSDPATILGEGTDSGYWIYLDRAYLDIDHMRVNSAILNLDEVWQVAHNTFTEWHDTCIAREVTFKNHKHYKCDRCNAAIYARSDSRFDIHENILNCPKCAAECADYWRKVSKLQERKTP